jgi:TolB protein
MPLLVLPVRATSALTLLRLFARTAIAATLVLTSTPNNAAAGTPLGIFDASADIGNVLHPGSITFDSASAQYTLAGSGENMWFDKDAFYFVWRKVSGDLTVGADVAFLGQGNNPHRKAVVMVRQSLAADSAYVDIALHGDGLTSLQYREENAAATHEIQSNLSAPQRLELEKHGDYFSMQLAVRGGQTQVAGGSIRVPIRGDFYVGIGICSHEKDLVEKAVFSNVTYRPLPAGAAATALYSALESINIASTDRRVLYVAPGRFEAPNWSRDGSYLIFNRNGSLEKISAGGGNPEKIDTSFANRCNNDHGISPDGKWLAISDQSQEDRQSSIYLLPITGGTPKRVTKFSPSYWHGWSPDGTTLAFVGQRNGEFDIYTIPITGGDETRLTTAEGLDDGPDYSPDGAYIYFNSERTGQMQVWRMKPDGSGQEQITSDAFNNWFPHPSPDGKWIVFLSYGKEVVGHPENKDVALRLMSLADRKISVLASLFGGQGTINVPSWSPDSKTVAFVSYQLLPPRD